MPQAPTPLHRALDLFRAVTPGVAGVVLASPEGRPLAHDPGLPDAAGLAAEGARRHAAEGGASAFVAAGGATYLVVLVPPA